MHARSLLLALVGLFVASASTVQAFGAGNIPTVAFYEGKAFRHGDIEDILTGMAKKAGGGFLGIGSGTKFSPLDLKRVYFGNWLRDYSQAIDIGTLKKTNYQTIVNLLMALGFMTFGYVSDEFEITEGRLGCYLPVEHIDNPKGYGEGQDPRQFYPGLRPPVDPRELQIDPQTGMKAYIAMEGHGWDTSKACIRRTIERCIHHGRLHRSTGRTEDEYEAYRLLGQAMHTLEDFPAHSNFCELALIKLGYTHVFPHVGQNARIKAPNGAMVPPLVTGTFGGSDFIHSLLGEAGDHLSEASISDLNKAVSRARSDPNNSDGGLVGLLRQIPGGDGEQASRDINEIRAAGGAGGDPNSMSPQQLHETLWKILVFRDKVMKGVETTIDRIPGLGALIEKITSSINVFIFSTIEPYLGPVLKQATGGLNNLSEEVINNPEQFAVFDNPNSDDPTHSFLSKDHFGLILNEPAGNLAKIIIRPAIKAVVEAWEDPTIDPRAVAERACEALFHPCFGTGRSQVQQEMLDYMHQWIESQGSHKQEVLNRLTAAKVRSNDNRRIGDTSSVAHSHDHHAGGVPSQGLQGVLATHNVHVPGAQYLNMGQDLLQGKMPGSVGFGSSQGQGRWRDMETSTAGGGGGSSGGGGYDSAPPPPAVQHAAAYGQPQHQHQPYQQQYQQPTSYGQPALQQQQHYQQHPQSSYGQPPPPPPSYGQQPHSYQAPPPQPSYGGGPPGGFSGSSSSGGGGGYPGQDHHGGRHPHQPLGGGDDFGRARPGEATDQWGNPVLPPPHSSGEGGHHRQEHGGGGGYHGGGGGYYGGGGGGGGY